MRLVATTVVRESIRGKQRTGFIYDVDWDARRVTRRLPVPEPNFPESDDNPRGGVRGGRGIAVTQHGIVVANYDTLSIYDDDWNLLDSLTDPRFVGLHEIDWDGTHVWVAATGIDALLKAKLDGTVEAAWDPHAPPDFAKFDLRRRPDPVDGSVDYRVREAPLIDQCHLNGVTRRDRATIVNCGLVRKRKSSAARTLRRVKSRIGMQEDRTRRRNSGRSLVVQLDHHAPARVLVELADHDFPTHNGQLLEDGRVALNDSTQNTFRVFEAADGAARETLAVRVPGTWLRGLEPVAPNRVVVGTAPASLVLVDVSTGSIDSVLELSEDPNEAVHGLTLCPPRDERL
jgi:hypothetical protein